MEDPSMRLMKTRTKGNVQQIRVHLFLFIVLLIPSRGIAQDLDVPYASTPPDVVEKMMEVARVGPGDYVIDLGCGDGRIVIAAARKGAFGHGVDLDPQRVKEARENAEKANVTHKVMFLEEDIFETDISQASVIALYLLSTVNEDLRPRLMRELEPGTRVVSHNFGMGVWEPDEHLILGDSYMDKETLSIKEQLEKLDHEIYLWYVPAKIEGEWRWQANGETFNMQVEQSFQKFYARLTSAGDSLTINNKKLVGEKISFTASNPNNGHHYAFNGRIEGTRITGTLQIQTNETNRISRWAAKKTEQP